MAYIGKITAGGSTYHVGSTLYGTCDTAAATAAKVAVVDGFDTLEAGVTVHIKFTNSNTAGSATLAIKPSSSGTATTAKNIYKYGTTAPGTTAATSWQAGSVVGFTYDGTAWQMNDHLDDTNTQTVTSVAGKTGAVTLAKGDVGLGNVENKSSATIRGELTSSDITTALGYTPPTSDTNNAVTQTATTTDANYEVLFSGTADNTTRTEGARKASGFIYNPSKQSVRVGPLRAATTVGTHAMAFGYYLEASGDCSHAEGASTIASNSYAHSEGNTTTASGQSSHAEGYTTTASGTNSHAEGNTTTASSDNTHAEGYETTASGPNSHAEGTGTIANHKAQHVFGEYNRPDASIAAVIDRGNYIEIVGNGTSSTTSNARTLDWSGNEWILGNLTLGGTASDITLNGSGNKWDGTNTSLKSALAGKLSTTGAAASANKLNTNAGQKGGNGTPDIPVYFSNGVPVANKIRIWTGSIAGNTDKVIDCAYGFVCVGRYYSGDRLWAGFVDQWGDGAIAIKATNTTSHCAVTVNTKGSKITISNKSSNYMSYFAIGSPSTES